MTLTKEETSLFAPTAGKFYETKPIKDRKAFKGFTSTDLQGIAHQYGLGKEADQILASKGEESDRIFSGGKIMDVIDAINILDYGIVGMLKGKGFKEGVRTRESFSKKDSLGQYGLLGTVAGILADVAVTWPLWAVASPFKVLSMLGIMGKSAKYSKAGKLIRAAKPGAIRKGFDYMFGLSDVLGIGADGAKKVIARTPKNKVQQFGQWITRGLLGALGADEVYGAAHRTTAVAKAMEHGKLGDIAEMFSKVDDEVASLYPKLFRRMPDGRMGLIPIEQLPKILDGNALEGAEYLWKRTAQLQPEIVAEKLVKEGDFSWMMNAYYDNFAKGKNIGGSTIPMRTKGQRFLRTKLKYATPEEIESAIAKATNNYAKKHAKEVKTLQKILADPKASPKTIRTATKRVAQMQDEVTEIQGKLRTGFTKQKEDVLRIRAEKGEIADSMYPVINGLSQAINDVENAKFFRRIGETHGITEEFAKLHNVNLAGYELMGAPVKGEVVNRLGALAGKYVPKYIAENINEMLRAKTTFEKVTGTAWGFFKWGKTAGNPAGHIRNIFSNMILNWWKLGMNPLDPRAMASQAEALAEIAGKGSKWMDEIIPLGYSRNTFATAELKAMFDGPDFVEAQKGFTAAAKRMIKKGMKITSNAYQGAEDHAKLSAFIFNRKYKGMGVDEAWRLAEAATFDYNAVGPWIRNLRTNMFGVPFLTFCVSDDTEILTQRGWLTCYEVTEDDFTLGYNKDTGKMRWQKIDSVNIFPYFGEMKHISARSLDILMTPDHRCVIKRKYHRRLPDQEYVQEITIDTAKNLRTHDEIVVAGDYVAPKEKVIPDDIVRLVGWVVTEGWIVKSAGKGAMFVGQTNKRGQEQIEELRENLGIDGYHITKEWHPNGNGEHRNYYFPAHIRDEFLKHAPEKCLTIEFLRKLTKEQLEMLYDILILADGCDSGSSEVLIQNPGKTADAMQALGVMLGRQFNFCKHDDALAITCTTKKSRQLKRNKPQSVPYGGNVWCPTTKDTTWVARRNGKVFITGNTFKATPLAAETALKAPWRISAIGKIKNAIENMSDLQRTKRERASEPQWIKDGLYVKLPMKDKHGRSAYFDLTYVIPFGDLISGQFFARQIDRETGREESLIESMVQKAPILNLITEIGKNQDFYGNKIWRTGDSTEKQIADLTRHITKMWMPPLVAETLPGGYVAKGKRVGQRRHGIMGRMSQNAEDNQYRTGLQEIMRHFAIKVQPISVDLQENFMEFERKRALETFLGEKGILRTYERAYIPKELK